MSTRRGRDATHQSVDSDSASAASLSAASSSVHLRGSPVRKIYFFVFFIIFVLVFFYLFPSLLFRSSGDEVHKAHRKAGEVMLYQSYEWVVDRDRGASDNPNDLACGRITVHLIPYGEPRGITADANSLTETISAVLKTVDKGVSRKLLVMVDDSKTEVEDVLIVKLLPEHQEAHLYIQIDGESILSNERFGLLGERKSYILIEGCSCIMEREDGFEIIPNANDYFLATSAKSDIPTAVDVSIALTQGSLTSYHLKRRYSLDINANEPFFVAYLESDKEIVDVPIHSEDFHFRLDINTTRIPEGRYKLHILMLLLNSKEEPMSEKPVIHTGPWHNGQFESCRHLRSHVMGSPFTVFVEAPEDQIEKLNNKAEETDAPHCDSLNSPGRWVLSYLWKWQPYDCSFHYFTADEVLKCGESTTNKWIYIVGAGELLEIANNFAQLYGKQTLEPQDQEFGSGDRKIRVSYKRSTWASQPTRALRPFTMDKGDLDPIFFPTEGSSPDVVIINASMGNELIYQTLAHFKAWLDEFIAYIDMYMKHQDEKQQKRATVIWYTPLFFWAPTYATNRPINAARLKLFSDYAREAFAKSGNQVLFADNYVASSSRVDCPLTGFLYDNPKEKSCICYALNHLLNYIYRDCKEVLS